MAQSFEEFIQCINIALDPESNQSVEDINNITSTLYSTPDTFYYIVQMYESNNPEILRLIPLIPTIFKNFIYNLYQQNNEAESNVARVLMTSNIYFDSSVQENPEIINYLTEMILENDNVDIWFCSNLWAPAFSIFHPQEILEKILVKMKQLFENSSSCYQNNQELQKAILLFCTLSSQRKHEEMLNLHFDEFSGELFKNYFTPENIENESLSLLTSSFVKEMAQLFKFYFDYFFNEEQCLIQFLNFIVHLSEYESDNVLSSQIITDLFQKIMREICGFILWIINPNLNRFDEMRLQFINSYFTTILANSINTALEIGDSFPYDVNMIISRVNLKIIGEIFLFFIKEDHSIVAPFFEQIFQLIYIYAELPSESQNQFIINPAVYYCYAYNQTFLSEFEPRSFSFVILKKLLEIDPQFTIQSVVNSEPSSGLMFLIGIITQKIIKILKKVDLNENEYLKEKEKYQSILTEEIFDQISNKIQELLPLCDFEPDVLILKSDSLLFLPEDQNQDLIVSSYEMLKNIMDNGLENWSSEQQFDFTIACKIVYSLLQFYNNSEEIFNSLQQHVCIIAQCAAFCLTGDAINAVSIFFMANNDLLIEKSSMLFDLYLSVILNITDNFNDDIQFLDKYENKIVDAAIKYVLEILKHKNAEINEQSFLEFLDCFFQGKEKSLNSFISTIMKYVAFFLPNGYEDYLAAYFDFSKNVSLQNICDYFTQPFIYFIVYNFEDFLNWEERVDFIQFSLSSFFDILENELNVESKNQNFEDSYFFGTLVSVLILSPDQLSKEDDENLLQFAIEKIQQNDNIILRYNCFDIITSVIRVLSNPVPDEIILNLLSFIEEGYVFRRSEMIRYSIALELTKDLYSPEIINEIEDKLNLLFSRQFQSKQDEIEDWFKDNKLGINDDKPYGFCI